MQWLARAWARWPLPRGAAVAVLGYHRVDDDGGPLAVSRQAFLLHMAELDAKRERQPVLNLDDAVDRLVAGTAPWRGVVVTFDDAWADNHANALGPLVEHRVPATVYVPSRLLGAPGRLTRTQLLEMAAAGVSVGAHSRTHADLTACSDAELEREVRGSREDLEDLLGVPCTRFAYPAGRLDARVRAAAAAAGFRTAVTAMRGWTRAGVDPLRIPRNFAEDFDAATFTAALRGGLNYLRPVDAARARLGRR
ncbi:MAG TPA: polysaccharide deacetylase family protein [Actinomycetes bacterium]|jgi:peptidoglycan/xylan/chitin deacetylase (PgdA/CDA1 family)|nr:polysaccharide deacetylase family protein [Actinomycetes bacterium]